MAIGLTRSAGGPDHDLYNSKHGLPAESERRISDTARPELKFRSVNRLGSSGYNSGLQRHHLLPLQLLSLRAFDEFFAAIGLDRLGFDDFRRNGLLLPCSDEAARMMAMPMHRGPHHRYNELAIERVAQIEFGWRKRNRSDDAGLEALFRLGLLQGALRRRLLDPGRLPIPLNRRDPAMQLPDFSDLDAMADVLWAATEIDQSDSPAVRSASSRLASAY